MSTKVDAAIDAPVAALAELPKHELEFWQRGNRLGVRVLYELNRRYPALAPWRRRRPRFAVSRPDFETLLDREPAIPRIRRSPSARGQILISWNDRTCSLPQRSPVRWMIGYFASAPSAASAQLKRPRPHN